MWWHLIRLSFGDVLLALLLWVPLLLLGTFGAHFALLGACRRRLRASGHPVGAATAILVVVHLVLAPLGAGAVGGIIAVERGLADACDDAGGAIVDWLLDTSLDPAQRALGVRDDDALVDVSELRRDVARRLDASRSSSLRARVDRVFWSALASAIDRAPPRLTWRALVAAARAAAHLGARHLLSDFTDALRAASHVMLGAVLGGLALLDGLTWLIVWLVARRPASEAAPPAIAA